MKTVVVLLILTLTLVAQIEFNRYSNEEFENISFSDSLMITTHTRLHESAPGAVQGPTEDTTSTNVMYTYHYDYDSLAQKITAYSGTIFYVDSLQKIIKIEEGTLKTTLFRYDSLSTAITVHPNEPTLNYRSKHYHYTYRPDGQIAALITIPVDWEYGQEPFWDTAHADTLTYTYNDAGQKTGAFYNSWTIDWSHGFPWERAIDSFTYTYDTLGLETITTITQLSKVGELWISKAEDTLWTQHYNNKHQLTREISQRYDYQNQSWDSTYYVVKEYTYNDSGRVEDSKEIQYYGDGTSTILEWHNLYTYGANSILSDVTPITSPPKSISSPISLHISHQNISVTSSVPIDQIILYSLQGRKIRQSLHSTTLSLQGVSKGQPFIAVVLSKGVVITSRKIFVQ